MTDNPATLQYGLARPRIWRRAKTILLVITGLALAMWIGYPQFQSYVTRVQLLRKQSRLMAWTWPANMVVFTDRPARASALLNDPRYDSLDVTYVETPLFVWPLPVVLKEDVTMPTASGIVSVHSNFCHRMESPNGMVRLVCLGTSVFGFKDGGRAVALVYRTFAPLSWSPRRFPPVISAQGLALESSPEQSLTLFAGQHDPNDPAHMTIEYELSGQGGTIDGWLQDDGTMVMKIRDGPAKVVDKKWRR